MKNDLDAVLKPWHKPFGKRTLYKDALSRLDANYEKRIGDLRLNFMLQLDLDVRRIITKDHSEDFSTFKVLETSDYYKYKIADVQSIEFLPSDQSAEESWVKIDGRSDIYTFRRYTGFYALATFRKEFEAFSRYKHPHIRQIFGVCESKLTPGIIFRGKLLKIRDYSTRDEACSVWSWISFLNGYNAVASYFRRHLKHSTYSIRQWLPILNGSLVYIDISTDDHCSVWPMPELSATTASFDPFMMRYPPPLQHTPLPLQQQILLVLRQRTLPMNTDIRHLLAGFYHSMETLAQHGCFTRSTFFPLPSVPDTNETWIISGARDLRKITFGDDLFVSGTSEARRPWQISSLSRLSSDDILVTDMGEWTSRFTVTRDMTIERDHFNLPRSDRLKAFRALLPQLRRILDGNTSTFGLVYSSSIRIHIRRRLEESLNRLNEKVVYGSVRNTNFSQCKNLEIYWSTDQNGQSRMEKAEVDNLGLSYTAEIFWGTYHFTNAHLKAIKVYSMMCMAMGGKMEKNGF